MSSWRWPSFSFLSRRDGDSHIVFSFKDNLISIFLPKACDFLLFLLFLVPSVYDVIKRTVDANFNNNKKNIHRRKKKKRNDGDLRDETPYINTEQREREQCNRVNPLCNSARQSRRRRRRRRRRSDRHVDLLRRIFFPSFFISNVYMVIRVEQ